MFAYLNNATYQPENFLLLKSKPCLFEIISENRDFICVCFSALFIYLYIYLYNSLCIIYDENKLCREINLFIPNKSYVNNQC